MVLGMPLAAYQEAVAHADVCDADGATSRMCGDGVLVLWTLESPPLGLQLSEAPLSLFLCHYLKRQKKKRKY